MKHDRVELDGGGTMVFEDARTQGFRCGVAGCREIATHACDQRLLHDILCNRPLCAKHTVTIGADLDLCPGHVRLRPGSPAQEELAL